MAQGVQQAAWRVHTHIQQPQSVSDQTKRAVFQQLECFSLSRTLDCGQCFGWEEDSQGVWHGVVADHAMTAWQEDDRLIIAYRSTEDLTARLYDYFDLGRDYRAIDRLLCLDERLETAAADARGIHILQQDPWEALCCFIFSQNNNIPRIKGIVKRFCAAFGTPLASPSGSEWGLEIKADGQGAQKERQAYTFPSPQVLLGLRPDDLAPLRCGFRAKYLLDAAEKVCDGTVDLAALRTMDLEQAREQLQTIRGVGPKVAECVLLYGCGRMECFPVDVWIGRMMEKLFPDGLPEEYAPVAGMAQQYLFHYGRMNKIR